MMQLVFPRRPQQKIVDCGGRHLNRFRIVDWKDGKSRSPRSMLLEPQEEALRSFVPRECIRDNEARFAAMHLVRTERRPTEAMSHAQTRLLQHGIETNRR